MWNKSALLVMVQVKVPGHLNFRFPVPVWVVKEFFSAVKDLAGVGEGVLRRIPLPQDEKASRHLNWVKGISLRGAVEVVEMLINDLAGYKGLEVVDAEVRDIRVKISLK